MSAAPDPAPLLAGARESWAAAGPAPVWISYAFVERDFDAVLAQSLEERLAGLHAFEDDQRTAFAAALTAWEAQGAVRFFEVADPADAMLRVLNAERDGLRGAVSTLPLDLDGLALPVAEVAPPAALVMTQGPGRDYDPGRSLHATLLHEIGHTLGLRDAPDLDDSVMGMAQSPGARDAAALARLYGADMAGQTGTWDGARFTLIGTEGDDALRAPDADSHLIGGAGDDRMWGRDGDDIFRPGAGHAWIAGGTGRDVVALDGPATDWTLARGAGADGVVLIHAGGDRVALRDVDVIAFEAGNSAVSLADLKAARLPDLVLEGGVTGLADLEAGTPQDITLTLRNDGAVAAPAAVTVFLHPGAGFSGGAVRLGAADAGPLAPGASVEVTVTLTLPAHVPGGAEYGLWIALDAGEALFEAAEGNNLSRLDLAAEGLRVINPDPAPRPDRAPATLDQGGAFDVADWAAALFGAGVVSTASPFALMAEALDGSGRSALITGHGFARETLDGRVEAIRFYRHGEEVAAMDGLVLTRAELGQGAWGPLAVQGGPAPDLLAGGPGDDTLTGAGGGDTYLAGTGADRIIGFARETDMLDLSAWHGRESLRTAWEVTRDGLRISGPDGTLLLEGLGAEAARDLAVLTQDGPQRGLDPGLRREGGAGAERLTGGAGPDTLLGREGDDTLEGGAGHDTLFGDAGADLLGGGPGDDLLLGRSGDDTLAGGAGADTLTGNGDFNTADYAQSSAAVVLHLADGTATGGHATGDVLSNIRGAVGSAHADRIETGDLPSSHVAGGAGADTLIGGAGRDTLIGGPGADGIEGHAGDDVIAGGAGADTLTGHGGFDRLDYGASAAGVTVHLARGQAAGGDAAGDVIAGFRGVTGSAQDDILTIGDLPRGELIGGAGDDALTGGTGLDTLRGGDGGDTLAGGAGQDFLFGGGGDDALDGGAGDDILNGEDGADALTGGDGHDTVRGQAGDDTLAGGAGDDVLVGHDGDDRLDGGAGDDALRGLDGADLILGGDGRDTVLGGTGGDTIDGGAGDDALYGLEDADSLTGGTGRDTVMGGAGDDTLDGGAEADTVRGQDGDDVVAGGAGDDLLRGDAGHDALDGGDGADILNGDGGHDTLAGGPGDDTVRGQAGDDALAGGPGADSLVGHDGDDTLRGEGEADRLFGGNGADLLEGGAGDDFLDGGNQDDTLRGGDGDDLMFGLAGADRLEGDAGADTLIGGFGADWLDGGDEADRLLGAQGADTLLGGAGDDTLFAGDAGDLLDGGDGADRLNGEAGNDTLAGGPGADALEGGAGDDWLSGGAGADTLTGGAGADAFVFAPGGGADRVLDFEAEADRLDLAGLGLARAQAGEIGVAVAQGGLRLDFGGGDTLVLVGLEEDARGDLVLVFTDGGMVGL